jgi:hypothetical protein
VGRCRAQAGRVLDGLAGGLSIPGVLVRRHDDQSGEREREDVTTMMLYQMTTQYQAERIKTAAEQRRVDDQLGMLAAEVSGLWRQLIRPARILRRQGRTALYAR